MIQRSLIVILSLLTGACASVGRQTKEVVTHPPNVPAQTRLETIPLVPQKDKNCGPATLNMALTHIGDSTDLETLNREVFTPEKKGTLPLDMVSAARRHGKMAVVINSLSGILQETASGHPVIVLENLGFSFYPQWHYSLIVGYDLPAQKLIRHSGTEAFQSEYFNYFERGWKLGDYWGLVVLNPGQLAASAGELAHLQGAVGLELAEKFAEAKKSYLAIRERWPESLGAHIGLGNLAYREKKFSEAIHYLEAAVRFHPDSQAARHNLAIAKSAQSRKR